MSAIRLVSALLNLPVVALVVAAMLAVDAPSLPEQPAVSPASYCPTDVGLFVPCRDADRIRGMTWTV